MSAITNVTYPTTPTEYLEFDMTSGVLNPDGTPNWNPVVAIEYTGSDRIVAYQEYAFLGSFRSRSSTTGVGTVASPMHFRIRPERWPVNRGIKLVPRPVDLSISLAPPIASTMPADQFTNNPFRIFANGGGRADWLTTSVNLAANPTIRANEFGKITAHVGAQSPENTSNAQFTQMVTTLANCAALSPPMPAYPFFRVFPSTTMPFASIFDIAYWTTAATWLHNCALVRHSGDPRIGLDTEVYSTVAQGTEPTLDTIATWNAGHGTSFSAAQLRAAMQPFLDQLIADNVNPIGMYPNVGGAPNNICLTTAYIVQAVGAARCAIWWENQTFEATETYRKDLLSFKSIAAGQQLGQAAFDNTILNVYGVTGSIQHLAASDEDEIRAWGKRAEPGYSPTVGSPITANGQLRWLFDTTRINPTKGTPSWLTGVDMSALNGVDYAHYIRTLIGTNTGGTTIGSVGIAATPITSQSWAGTAALGTNSGSALTANGSLVGLQIPTPPVGSTWCGMKLPGVLPGVNTTPWTHKCADITIPSTISADTPLIFNGQNNVEVWQLVWIEATSEIRLLVKATGVNAYTVATGLAKGIAHRVVIGRSGTTWRHSINGGAAVDHTAPSQASFFVDIMYGMGCDFATMANNTQISGKDIIFTDQALTYVTSGLLSTAQFAQLSYNGPYDSGSHKNAHHNYPFEWFT